MDKTTIRLLMKEKRLSMKQETFSLYNESIYQQLITHPRYLESKIIGCYVSLPDEVQTIAFLKEALHHHRVCVPRIENQIMNFYEITSLNDLKPGHFHVLEPITNQWIESSLIDLMIVPMLAFDKRKYRVGYGKGYYDKYFSQGCPAYKLGLAFSFQEVDMIDNDVYDYPLDEIITQ